MGDVGEQTPARPSISSREHEELLNIIDTIRSQGVSRYNIAVPQIVVCGDQSSGKSSTLEAICGLRFPTSDGLCTRFATEYVLRRIEEGEEETINISILPDPEDEDRSDDEIAKLTAFKPSKSDLEEFVSISKEAADAMGIDKSGKVFSHDVLRIEICGPKQPHLTLVDLPGLFHAGVDRKGDENVDAVNSLVQSYIENPRSIILAVVSAKNDLNLQKVIKFIRDFDAGGDRTLGVITKPDTLPVGSPSESQYQKVALNMEVPYALGWHVVKNRSYEQRDCSTEDRDIDERRLLSKGIWNALPAKQKGVGALRTRLSKVLQNHILVELPNLLKDIDAGISDCNSKLEALGGSRKSLQEQRQYLLRASDTFSRLLHSAVDGDYSDAFFRSSDHAEGFEKRLRAKTKDVLTQFAETMRVKGHAVELVEDLPWNYSYKGVGVDKVLKDNFYKKVQDRMRLNRGRELPGLFNPSIIGDLFLDQSSPWSCIVAAATNELLEAAHDTVRHVLQQAADDNTMYAIQGEIISPAMELLEKALAKKAEEVLKPHKKGHPQTLNHYFIENIQKRREDESRKAMAERISDFFGGCDPDSEHVEDRMCESPFDVKHLLNALTAQTEVDMDRFAAIEAVNAMLAYYKVALKTVIDVFSQYALEECLLVPLTGIFTPESVYTLDDQTVTRIAGESEQSIEDRGSLTKKLAILRETRKILHRMDRHRPSGSSTISPLLATRNNQGHSCETIEPVAHRSLTPPIEPMHPESGLPDVEGAQEIVLPDNLSRISSNESIPVMPPGVGIPGAIECLNELLLVRYTFLPGIRHSIGHLIQNLKLLLGSLKSLPPKWLGSVKGNVSGTKGFLLGLCRQVPDVLPFHEWDSISVMMPAVGNRELNTWQRWADSVINFTFKVCNILASNRAFRL